jgi:hypothetical protein
MSQILITARPGRGYGHADAGSGEAAGFLRLWREAVVIARVFGR